MPSHIQQPAAQHRPLCSGPDPRTLLSARRPPPSAQRSAAQPVTGGGRGRERGAGSRRSGAVQADKMAAVQPGSRAMRRMRAVLGHLSGTADVRAVPCGSRAAASGPEDVVVVHGRRTAIGRAKRGVFKVRQGSPSSRGGVRGHLTLRPRGSRRRSDGGAVISARCVLLIPCACRTPRPTSCCLPS